jgi:DNA-binding beta-propeller fold protein YncE
MTLNPAAPRKVIPVADRPVGVTRGWGGKYFVTTGKGERDADGAVKVVDVDAGAGTVRDFAAELDQPGGIAFTGKLLIVADGRRIWRIDATGARSLLVDEDDFPAPPARLTGVACQPGGKVVYAADPGDPARMRNRAGNLWPPDSAAAQALT